MQHKKKFIRPVVSIRQGAPESLLAGSNEDTGSISENESDTRQAKVTNVSVFDFDKTNGTDEMFGKGSF